MKINPQVQASFARRGTAYIIDVLVVLLIIITPFYHNADKSPVSDIKSLIKPELTKTQAIAATIISILVILYWAVFEYMFNQSIGKMLTRIQVISLSKRLSFSQVIVRNISKFSSIIVLIDCLNMLISKSNQRFLEKLSKTQAVLK
ncbi:RDD family protein [Candidatus Woesearchaeota archaeon]|nr:RDD family protein [Candidatus Woesearchaeota archaeon]